MSGKFCVKRNPRTSVLKELNSILGNNDVSQSAITSYIFQDGEFSPEFISWFQAKYNTEEIPNIKETNKEKAKKLAEDAKSCFYDKYPSVTASTRIKDIDVQFIHYGYTNSSERENGKRHVGNIILDMYNESITNDEKLPSDRYRYYLKKLKGKWLNMILKDVSNETGMTLEEVKTLWKNTTDKLSFLEDSLKGKDNSTVCANRLAVYQELFGSEETALSYLQEIFCDDTRLSDVFAQVKDSLDVQTIKEAVEAAQGENPDEDTDSELIKYDDPDPDTTILLLNSHSGLYNSYLTHVGPRIRNYFNSLKRMASRTIGDYDTNNSYGLVERMDANTCCTMIYNNNVSFKDIASMIETIKHIGETVPGFESFIQVAEDLTNNLDFATELFSVFAKMKIHKYEVDIKGDQATVKQSNQRVTADSALFFDIRNDAKGQVINNDDYIAQKSITIIKDLSNSIVALYDSISDDIDSTKTLQTIASNLNKAKIEIANLIRSYFPSIEESAIKAYIELNNNTGGNQKQQVKNILDLVNTIKNIVDKTNDCRDLYNQIQIKSAEIKEHNEKLEESSLHNFIDLSEYKSYDEVVAIDYISPVDIYLGHLKDKLLPYSVVDTALNDRNIYGNMQSNVINSSWITNFNHMFDTIRVETVNGKEIYRSEELEAWGLKKLRNSQYKYSHFLVEQYDENGEVLNKETALFRWEGDQLRLTENAKNVRVNLLNGSSNLDEGKNIDYAKMTEGDYIPTSFIQFFKNDAGSDKIANYFLRTPSDAPKNFAISSGRFDTTGLFEIADIDEFNKNIDEIVNEATSIITVEELKQNYLSNSNGVQSVETLKLKRYLFGKGSVIIQNGDAVRKIEGSESEDGKSFEGYLTLMTDEGSVVVVKGSIHKAGKGQAIVNPRIEAIVDTNGITGSNIDPLLTPRTMLYDYYRNKLRNHNVIVNDKAWLKPKLKVNTNHKVFKLLKNQFKQEMLDAAKAVHHYFNTTEKHYRTKAEKEASRKDLKSNEIVLVTTTDDKTHKVNIRKDRSNTKGYKNYHLNKNGKVYEETEDGYTLDGQVFNSTKFSIVVNETNENGEVVTRKRDYLNELIVHDRDGSDNGMINFLYGGAMEIIFDTDTQQVVDVRFSEKQNQAIDEKLAEFINDYNEQGSSKILEYNDFIHNVSTNAENIIQFNMNQLLMHMTYDELFEGSTKFYKNAQTVLKRAKESQASGIPYGIANYNFDFEATIAEIQSYSFLNNGTITRNVLDEKGKPIKNENGTTKTETISVISIIDAIPGLKGVRQRNGFHGVTVKNSIRTNTKALNALKEILIKQGRTEEEAMNLLYGSIVVDKNGNPKRDKKTGEIIRENGYTDTTVNDAQSYITFPEFVRRIAARGQLQRYLPLLKKLGDENAKLSASDLKEFVQVQKNIYYDIYYDERYGIEVPRQIKNAEFVLIPRFIKGTQLAEVYKFMEEAGIDQLNTVETSKAANEEILTLWDDNGDIQENVAKNFVKQASEAKQIYSYNYLYTQQETPQHMNSENKAGIQIVKKIIDNLPDDPNTPLGALKTEFFKLFGANIKESFNDLLDDFSIERDENGNIKVNQNGTIENIDLKVFFNKLKDELMRTGMDSNMADYVTFQKGSSIPVMPIEMNNMITKFESIVQSLFNSNITRQKLPGFHAAQVTNIGWKSYGELTEEERKHISYNKELQYHPDGEPYIQVLVPYSILGIDKNSKHYKNMTDEQILNELAAEGIDGNFGLDTVIGYRIPTEGKQSVANMKIVGFIDDSLGSTIIVPDDWVSQTGSDFDIDSVYGIQYETYKTRDGQVKKVKYKKVFDKYDYVNYLKHNFRKDENSNDLISALNSAKDPEAVVYRELHNEESNLYNSLPKDVQEAIKKRQSIITKLIKNNNIENGKEAYRFRINNLIDFFDKVIDNAKKKNSTKYVEIYKQLKEYYNDIDLLLNGESEEYNERLKERISRVLNNSKKEINELATSKGLLTLEEFTDANNAEQLNNRKARNSRIVEVMQSILNDPATLEENLSRSNFDGITKAKNNNMDPNVKIAREGRSAYNWFDQAAFQEDAMSGAKLKAFSVTLDTFCSVCNVVRPTLEQPIYIVYNSKSYENPNEIVKRFNGEKYKKGDKSFKIRHNTYGWSSDNRAVNGMLLTAWSSQTTAFILDAIKEGAIPNVNDYTFSVFKTLANIGTDYDTSVSFITQPGIKRIVDAYNANKSVFVNSFENPIHTAIRGIAEELGVNANSEQPITAIMKSLNKRYGEEFNKIFGQKGDEEIKISLDRNDTKDLPIIVSKLQDRLKHRGEFKTTSPVGSTTTLLFDLGVILSYNNIKATADNIGSIARCCNPDRFGAKQTVYSTRQVFDNILKCFNETTDKSTDEIISKPVLSVNGGHILEAIYPGVSEATTVDEMINIIISNDNIDTSKYPTLYAFLKYATATSTVIAKNVFATQTPQFRQFIEGIKYTFSGYNPELDEATYNDFQKYVISTISQNCPSIAYKLKVRKNESTGDIEISYYTKEVSESENYEDKQEKDEERHRIYGYERYDNTNITKIVEIPTDNGKTKRKAQVIALNIENVNNPTEDEMELFEQLSPAQKVQFIKSHFTELGVFKYIKPNLYNDSRRGRFAGMQTLEFIEQTTNPNAIYNEFNIAFNSNNPLIVSAAIDIVKYAFQVEGMRMSSTAVNKVIDNECLYKNFDDGGLGFVEYFRRNINNMIEYSGTYDTNFKVEEMYENYLRGHHNNGKINTIRLTNKNRKKYGLFPLTYGIYCLKPNASVNEETAEKERKKFNELCKNAGIKYYLPLTDEYISNKYVRIQSGNKTNLYRIKDINGFIVLYPLGNLNTNENSTWSVKEDNNIGVRSKDVYNRLLNEYITAHNEEVFNKKYIDSKIEEYKKQGVQDRYRNRKELNKQLEARDFSIEEMSKEFGGSWQNLKGRITEHFKDPLASTFVTRFKDLNDYILTPGVAFGKAQEIVMPDGRTRKFYIYKPSELKNYNNLLIKKEDGSFEDISAFKSNSFREVVESKRKSNSKNFNDTFVITPVEEEFASQVEEVMLDGIDFVKARNQATIDRTDPSKTSAARLSALNIKSIVDDIKANKTSVSRELAFYATNAAEYIEEELFNRFIPNPEDPNLYISITDDEAIAAITKDDALLNKYMKAVNEAIAFINTFEYFIEDNFSSEEPETQHYIDKIKAAVIRIKKLPIQQVMDAGHREIVDKTSTNPLVKEGLLDVMDAYYKTYGPMWMFHDIMENGTPILQVMLKTIMSDIDARQKQHLNNIRNHRKKIKELQEKAAAEGLKIDIQKLIDPDSKWIENYNGDFSERYDELKRKRDEAAQVHGLGSIEHLKAKLAYDTFLAVYVNQPAKQEYYIKKVKLEHQMLYGKYFPVLDENDENQPNIAEAYSRYMKLYYERLQVYKTIGKDDSLSEEERKKINDIERKMFGLYNDDYYIDENGQAQERPILDPVIRHTSEEIENYRIYRSTTAAVLSDFLKQTKELNEEYFQYEEYEGFRNELEHNLAIVNSFEKPVNGIPTVPQSVIAGNETYIKAKDWIRKNARFAIDEQIDENGKPTGISAKLKKALAKLKASKNGKLKSAQAILANHNHGEGIYDEKGIPDGSKLSDEEIAQLKEAQSSDWNVANMPVGTDRILISNAKPTTDVFFKEFYKGLNPSSSKQNSAYLKAVTKLNKLLEPFVNGGDGNIHLELIEDSDEGIALLEQIAELYQEIRKTKTPLEEKDAEKAKNFIEENVEFEINKNLWNAQNKAVLGRSQAFIDAWNKVVFERTKDGEFVNTDGKFKPNRFLYSYAKPKGKPGDPSYDEWVDNELKEAQLLIEAAYRTVPTKYYYQAMNEALARSESDPNYDYNTWYQANHIYNPFTRKMEPLQCWTYKELNPEFFKNSEMTASWKPRSNQRRKTVREGMYVEMPDGSIEVIKDGYDKSNPNYKPNIGHKANYIQGANDGKYDNKVSLNKYEIEMREYLKELLLSTAHIRSARDYFLHGNLPKQALPDKTTTKKVLKEVAKLSGLGVSTNTGNGRWENNIGYENDYTPEMPMTHVLNNKNTIDLSEKLKKLNENKPTLEKCGNNQAEFERKFKEYEDERIRLEEQIKKERQAITNRDWYNVIECYLEQAARYNAIHDNKQGLYFLQNVLKNLKMYSREKGAYGNLKQNDKRSTEDAPYYETAVDENLIKQYETFLRRIMYNQWKEKEGALTNFGNNIQGFASANYMMLNFRGGIANVTLGMTGIFAEAAAREFFGKEDWAKGTAEWYKGSIGFMRSAYHNMIYNTDRSYSVQDAIVKFMNVVDYDEHTGVRRTMSMEEYSKKIRDIMFSPQTIGEHFMQNSVLFSMLKANKLITMSDGETTYMNERDYISYRQSELLDEILSNEQYQKFQEFKAKIKKDKNVLSKYAWFRRDTLTDFVYLHCSKEQIKEFRKKRDEHVKQFKEEFANKEDLYSQMELGSDGKLAFKEGSELAYLNTIPGSKKSNVTKAMKLLGEFAEKTRKVNNRIHGAYNSMGAATIEKSWFGSLVMQYHKHIPMGLLKRYATRGFWNETRGAVTKGMLTSVKDYFNLNLRKIQADNNLSDKELGGLEALKFTFMHIKDYLGQLGTTYQMLPDYDKANIKRNLNELASVVGALCLLAAIWAISGGDDDDDSIAFNLCLYEADRLAAETFMWNPIGMVSEVKKTMTTPIAGYSVISDITQTTMLAWRSMFDPEFQAYYETGKHAGENKFAVRMERRIPIWHGIKSVLDTPSNNHFYKVGKSVSDIIPVKQWVVGEE